MSAITRIFILSALIVTSAYVISINSSSASVNSDCDVYIYVANNSMFDINMFIDNVGVGRILMGGNKTFTFNLVSAKRLKIRAEYSDPDYIDPRSINYVTHQKLDCGMSDSIYVSFTKN